MEISLNELRGGWGSDDDELDEVFEICIAIGIKRFSLKNQSVDENWGGGLNSPGNTDYCHGTETIALYKVNEELSKTVMCTVKPLSGVG